MAKPKVGILAGTFDPVHTGHLVFALQALKAAKLDAVYFLPERRPRRKPDVVHFGHRTAMLSRAIRPYPQLGLIELPDIYLNVNRTLPKLQQQFAGADLVFLMGSDAVVQMNADNWPGSDLANFLSQAGLIIGLRNRQERPKVESVLKSLPARPLSQSILELPTKRFSASRIRYGFRHGQAADGLLASVQAYARVHWLYVSLAGE
jgi:nicotinate-nucleotide adenylyltransferase